MKSDNLVIKIKEILLKYDLDYEHLSIISEIRLDNLVNFITNQNSLTEWELKQLNTIMNYSDSFWVDIKTNFENEPISLDTNFDIEYEKYNNENKKRLDNIKKKELEREYNKKKYVIF